MATFCSGLNSTHSWLLVYFLAEYRDSYLQSICEWRTKTSCGVYIFIIILALMLSMRMSTINKTIKNISFYYYFVGNVRDIIKMRANQFSIVITFGKNLTYFLTFMPLDKSSPFKVFITERSDLICYLY